jgi:hypothetical protein
MESVNGERARAVNYVFANRHLIKERFNVQVYYVTPS